MFDFDDSQEIVFQAKTAGKSLIAAKYDALQVTGDFLFNAHTDGEFAQRCEMVDEQLSNIAYTKLANLSDSKMKLVKAIHTEWNLRHASCPCGKKSSKAKVVMGANTTECMHCGAEWKTQGESHPNNGCDPDKSPAQSIPFSVQREQSKNASRRLAGEFPKVSEDSLVEAAAEHLTNIGELVGAGAAGAAILIQNHLNKPKNKPFNNPSNEENDDESSEEYPRPGFGNIVIDKEPKDWEKEKWASRIASEYPSFIDCKDCPWDENDPHKINELINYGLKCPNCGSQDFDYGYPSDSNKNDYDYIKCPKCNLLDFSTDSQYCKACGHNPGNYVASRTANKYIEKRGDSWVILQKGTGKVLSHHDSKEKAEASFRAMMQSKHGSDANNFKQIFLPMSKNKCMNCGKEGTRLALCDDCSLKCNYPGCDNAVMGYEPKETTKETTCHIHAPKYMQKNSDMMQSKHEKTAGIYYKGYASSECPYCGYETPFCVSCGNQTPSSDTFVCGSCEDKMPQCSHCGDPNAMPSCGYDGTHVSPNYDRFEGNCPSCQANDNTYPGGCSTCGVGLNDGTNINGQCENCVARCPNCGDLTTNYTCGHPDHHEGGESIFRSRLHDDLHEDWHRQHGDTPCTSVEDCKRKSANYENS